MKIKTSELTGAALDWAVAKCEGTLPASYDDWTQTWPYYSSSMSGVAVVEREQIGVGPRPESSIWPEPWLAASPKDDAMFWGPTPLIAAMRCYVTSKLGDEVEVPEELL